MMQDPISDMFTRIRNGLASAYTEVIMPISRIKFDLAHVLKEEGYINDYQMLDHDNLSKRSLRIELKYYQGQPVIHLLKRVSRPGLRVYRPKDQLPLVSGGYGIAIISTSRGLLTDRVARGLGCGGEVICLVS